MITPGSGTKTIIKGVKLGRDKLVVIHANPRVISFDIGPNNCHFKEVLE